MLTPASIIHDGGTDTKGPEGFHPFYERIRSTFPDNFMDVEDTFAEGDKICVRWSCTGTHTGDGLGIPPTQLTVCHRHCHISHSGRQACRSVAELGHAGHDGAAQGRQEIAHLHRRVLELRPVASPFHEIYPLPSWRSHSGWGGYFS